MSTVKDDLAAVKRTLAIINGATIAASDAPVVTTVLNYLNHIQALLTHAEASENENEKTSKEQRAAFAQAVDATSERTPEEQ